MSNALVFDMPMELCLELMAIVGSHFSNAKGELFDDVVDERDSAGLIVALIDFESSDARCIVDGGVLVTFDRFVVFVLERQELNVNLNLMARNLLLVPDRMNFAKPGAARQAIGAIALENAVNASI
jgi:hypothetical protein